MVELLVTYMEAVSPAANAPVAPPVQDVVVTRERLDAKAYLKLYTAVGTSLQWDLRLRMPRAELEAHLAKPSTIIFVLRLGGQAVGLCEFDCTGEAEVELVYFGLVPEVQGRRLGPYLLDWSLRRIWTRETVRIWLHTDTNDHPKAQDVYRRAGFTVFDRRYETFAD